MIRALGLLLWLGFSLQAEDWRLVWSDEFSGEGFPDEAKWTTETGFLRNKEKQFYTGNRKENVRLEGGHLVLECRQEEYSTPEHGRAQFTSGSLTTEGKASWTYGRFEIRARMPQGKGTWVSLWLLGVADSQGKPWPECGEIDIAEHVGKLPRDIYGTVHFQKNGQHRKREFETDEFEPPEDFHVYAAEWTPERIRFFLDGERYGSFAVSQAGQGESNPFHQPFFLMISLALGGTWGGPIDSSALPQQLRVDYVRIYQKAGPAENSEKSGWDIGPARSR